MTEDAAQPAEAESLDEQLRRYHEWVAAHPARASIPFETFCEAAADKTLTRLPVLHDSEIHAMVKDTLE